MANFPSYVQTPPTPTGNAARYLEVQNRIAAGGMVPSAQATAAFDELQTLGAKIQKNPKEAYELRANSAHNMMVDLQKNLAAGTWQGRPLTAEERKGMEASLKKLEQGQLPTKGGSIDIKSGNMIAEPPTASEINKLKQSLAQPLDTSMKDVVRNLR
ncbi:MAG: hypothetical protein U1E65_34895 [Myxococcota bacterium]